MTQKRLPLNSFVWTLIRNAEPSKLRALRHYYASQTPLRNVYGTCFLVQELTIKTFLKGLHHNVIISKRYNNVLRYNNNNIIIQN